ncbi:MAG: glycosyltransferase [Pseudomonadota bacterium]
MTKDLFFVNSSQGWGGGEKWHLNAARALGEDYKVCVIGAPGSELSNRARSEGMVVQPLAVSNLSFLNPLKLFRLYRLFKRAEAPAVILNLPSDVKLAGVAARLAGVRRIVYRRGMPKPLKNTFLNRFLFSKVVTDVIVNSNEIGRSLVRKNKDLVDTHKIHLVYNGVDIGDYSDFTPAVLPGAGDSCLKIGTAGRMVEQKNQMILIEMMGRLKARGYSAKLYIAGDGPLKPQISALIAEKGLQEDVILLGFLKDSREMLSAIDIFAFPSHYEGSANAIVEAMAMELPVVAFNVSSMPEMVVDGETGFLARYNDVDDFTRKVSALLDDETLRLEMGRSGKARAARLFSASGNMDLVKHIVS